MRIHVVLYKGQWKRSATASHLREQLQRVFGDDLCNVEFPTPDDTDVAVDAMVRVYTDKNTIRDLLCDKLFEALLRRMEPEYESMLEVEVLDM